MKTTLSRQIIWNFFEGKTTPMQNTLIQEWLADPNSQELYFQWLEEWERDNPQFTPNVEAAYARSLQLVQGVDPQTDDITLTEEPVVRSFVSRFRFVQWVAAACVMLVAGAYLLRNEWYYKRYETGYGEVRTIRLPDNSRVSLNAHSVLTVPRFGFGSGQREVQLTGETRYYVARRYCYVESGRSFFATSSATTTYSSGLETPPVYVRKYIGGRDCLSNQRTFWRERSGV